MTRFPLLRPFLQFVIERHRIYERRAAGKPAPWTTDPILATYRFCNVYRELDRVTQWIAKRWREPEAEYQHLWFAMVVARLLNHPETLTRLSLPGRWNRRQFERELHARQRDGEKVFGSAYIVSTNGRSMDKVYYLAEYVLDPLWMNRYYFKPQPDDTLESFHRRLCEAQGMGSFMAAQVVADLKYVAPLSGASDWWTFASSGPGSRRGMNYLLGLDPREHWNEEDWRKCLNDLSAAVAPHILEAKMTRLHNQDLQNCLCEFSKYRRTQLGTGRPKQKFTPYEGR